MSDTIVVTSIYREFWGTKEFRKSVERTGLPLHNAFKGHKFTGNGDVIRNIYEALLELRDKYKYAIYSDGADSYFIKSFTPPDGYILYSTEKAIWPPTAEMQGKWKYFWNSEELRADAVPETPWKYLNGGGYCGEIDLLIKFFEKYGLDKLEGDVNGQKEQSDAFITARHDRFPIFLDTLCRFFQTTGFEEEGDFEMGTVRRSNGTITKIFANAVTGTMPYVLHGNGRTDMRSIYKHFNPKHIQPF